MEDVTEYIAGEFVCTFLLVQKMYQKSTLKGEPIGRLLSKENQNLKETKSTKNCKPDFDGSPLRNPLHYQ
jgi:hypothetical protein